MLTPEFIPKPASENEEEKIFKDNINAGFAYNEIERENAKFNAALINEDNKNSAQAGQMEGISEFNKIKIRQNIELNNRRISEIESELINQYGHNRDNLDEKLAFAERSDRKNDQSYIDHYNEIHYLRSQLLDSNEKLERKIILSESPREN